MPTESVPEPTATRATVYAGISATDYVHAGRGAVVVLLGRRSEDPLFVALARQFRVIAPDLPNRAFDSDTDTPTPPFSDWLQGFLDCLGIARVSLVVDPSFERRARQFCASDAMRVDRLVLLTHRATGPDVAVSVVRVLLGS